MKKLYLLILGLLITVGSLNAQWSTDPAENLKISGQIGDQVIPKIRLAPDGSYFVGYFSLVSGSYNVRLQRFDSYGNKLWADDGLLVSDHPSMSWLTDWDMAVDLDGHAILTWQDIRDNGNNNVVAYRISPDGVFNWGADGMMLSNSTAFDAAPKVTVTSSNNAVIAWMSDNTLIRQKISPQGNKLWGENGITMSGTVAYSWPQLMPVGDDDVLMKYYQDSGPAWSPTRHVFLQRFNASGQGVWPSPAVVSNAGTITAWTQILPMINDDNDGCIITWHDFRVSGTVASAWVQHISNSGQLLFQANGVKVSDADDMNQFYPQVSKKFGEDNIYVYWNEVNGDQNQFGISAQKLSPTGERLWPDNGKVIFPMSSTGILPQRLLRHNQGVVLIYEDYFNGIETSLQARLLNAEGEPVWSPASTALSSVQSSKVHMDMSKFDGNQWVFAWEDDRDGDVNLFAQNLRADGVIGPVTDFTALGFNLSVEGNMVPINEVDIFLDGIVHHTNAEGYLYFLVEPGEYILEITHPYIFPIPPTPITLQPGTTTMIEATLSMKRTNMTVLVNDQYGMPIPFNIPLTMTGPETTYSGMVVNGELQFSEIPYGHYAAEITFEGTVFASETTIDDDNNSLVFVLVIDNLAESNQISQLMIFPNPVSNQSVLKFNSQPGSTVKIELIGQKGNVLGTTTVVTTQSENSYFLSNLFNLNRLSQGVYTLKVNNGKSVQNLKMIVSER